MNPTDLRRRLEQVSRPAGDKLNMETSGNILEPLTEKLEDIAQKLEKERRKTEANWEQSQRELEEVRHPSSPENVV